MPFSGTDQETFNPTRACRGEGESPGKAQRVHHAREEGIQGSRTGKAVARRAQTGLFDLLRQTARGEGL